MTSAKPHPKLEGPGEPGENGRQVVESSEVADRYRLVRMEKHLEDMSTDQRARDLLESICAWDRPRSMFERWDTLENSSPSVCKRQK